jgi:hypothetical protein
METLQKTMNTWLEELPRLLLADLLNQKLSAQGIKLSKRKRGELADKILNGRLNTFDFDDGRKGDGKRIMTIEFTEIDSELMETKFKKFTERLPDLIDDLTEKTSQSILSTLKGRWPSESRAQRRDLDGFRKRLQERWGDGLEQLRMLITIAREYGYELNKAGRRAGSGNSPKTFEILIRLHARSCQIAEEIACLLSNGFADGAMARWRTLHEIAAVGCLIRRHGEELAERYEHHQIVESRKAALQYKQYQKRLRQKPLSKKALKEIEADYVSALKTYGTDFRDPQGWAAKHLGKRNPSIADIQEAAGIDYLAPYYRMASHNVHANPKGVFFKLGLLGETDTLLAGPSNAGLADPGHATALSLVLISSLLLHLYPTLDNNIVMKVIQELGGEIGSALLSAHKKLEADDRVLSGTGRN